MSFQRFYTAFLTTLLLPVLASRAGAQENLVPLSWNVSNPAAGTPVALPQKTTALALPFFEDFTGPDLYPDPQRWIFNRQVYVNNTMGVNPVAQGVCTFDALGAGNRPYDTLSAFGLNYADSLTTQPFDLSAFVPNDSLYLSFFYQPQGAGFAPETTDSLMLYFRHRNGRWIKQWGKEGTALQPFRQVMVPVADTGYLYTGFQFRFVNKASINLNDDVWNLDYIRMGAGRSWADTMVDDPALGTVPGNLLRDYTAMPYRHYAANAAAETGADLLGFLRNNKSQPVNATVQLTATDARNGAVLATASQSLNPAPYTTVPFRLPGYQPTVTAGVHEPVGINHRFAFSTTASQASAGNDTLNKLQVFDNYFAYDDGTAEKAYYLNLLPSLPGKVALEFHANVADTLRGAAILFGNQVPTAAGKFFTLQLYRRLTGVAGATADELLYTQDFYQPRFRDSVNRFYYYTFGSPVALPAGNYYFCVMQPALSGSDSLYYAVDVNRVGGNHLYYNVEGIWRSSTISGALMIRPLVGAPVAPSAVQAVPEDPAWTVYPNPAAAGELQLGGVPEGHPVQLTDMTGREVFKGLSRDGTVSLPPLPAGVYLVRWQQAGARWTAPKKWILMSGL